MYFISDHKTPFLPSFPTREDLHKLGTYSQAEFLRLLFTLDKERLSRYSKFIVVTDVFLRLTGRIGSN